jgi:putative transposase
MGRHPRVDYQGALHHANAHSVDERPLYETAVDRVRFLQLVGQVCFRFGWRCAAYCLMDTHYHLLLETPEAQLAKGMSWLNGGYARGFNKRYGRRGHLFRDRYYTRLVTRGEHGTEAVRYIALNPVRAGACASPRMWRWSSYPAALGLVKPEPWLDRHLLFDIVGLRASAPGAAERLAAFVEDCGDRDTES